MTMYNKRYYIMHEDKNGELKCVVSYGKIEDAKRHAKQVVDIANKDCLILEPVVRIKPDMGFIIRDIERGE